LPSRLWAAHHGLKSVPSLDDARIMASFVRYPDADGARRRPGHRQYDSQGSPLGGGRKRGAEAQAIGRSRGGRTTKIHAIVDSRGRPIALEVTPGQLGDVRVALALISAVPPGPPPGRRRRLRQRRTAALAHRTWNPACHPQQSDTQEAASLRRGRLSPPQFDRAYVLPPQGLAPHRNPLRQARFKLRRSRRDRSRNHLVDLIECGA
jgi:transposase